VRIGSAWRVKTITTWSILAIITCFSTVVPAVCLTSVPYAGSMSATTERPPARPIAHKIAHAGGSALNSFVANTRRTVRRAPTARSQNRRRAHNFALFLSPVMPTSAKHTPTALHGILTL